MTVGLHSVLERHDASLAQDALLARIAALNADPAIHGILVQMPLPKHLDAAPRHRSHRPGQGCGRLLGRQRGRADGRPAGPAPGNAAGLHEADREHGRTSLRGKHAVVIGRSNTVGKPMALLLLQAHATVTVCHSADARIWRGTHARPTSSSPR